MLSACLRTGNPFAAYRLLLLGLLLIGTFLGAPYANAFDVSKRREVAPPAEIQVSEGSQDLELAPLPQGAIVFTSVMGYETRKDDDYSFQISPEDEIVLINWSKGKGQLDVIAHKIDFANQFSVLDRIDLTSDQIRAENNDWTRSFSIADNQRCIIIVETREAVGSDDDASYRIATNNESGGVSRACTINATLGEGKNRDFRFSITVLVWLRDEPGVTVTVEQLKTSGQTSSLVTLPDFEPGDVTIANPIVDWGSDDDVSFQFDYIDNGVGATLSRTYGAREIEYELISLNAPRPCFSGCEDKDDDGFGTVANSGCRSPEADCDDHDPSINPDVSEDTPGDFLDNDCDALTDDNGCGFGQNCDLCAASVLVQMAGFGDPDAVAKIEFSDEIEDGLAQVEANNLFSFIPRPNTDFNGAELFRQIDDNGGHVQGFARVQTARPHASIVLTRDNRGDEPSGFLLARLSKVGNNGGNRLDPRGISNGPPINASEARAFIHIPETKHPGGIQTAGNILALPINCDSDACDGRAQVQFYNMNACFNADTTADCLINQLALPSVKLLGFFSCNAGTGVFGGLIGGAVFGPVGAVAGAVTAELGCREPQQESVLRRTDQDGRRAVLAIGQQDRLWSH